MHTERSAEENCRDVRESLFDFVTAHNPKTNLNAVDDVIASYIYAAVEAVDNSPENFYQNADEFVDIVSAYIPEFEKIDRESIYLWLMNIVGHLNAQKRKPYMDEAAKPEDSTFFKKDIFSFPKESPSKTSSNSSSRSNSTSEDDTKFPVNAEQKSNFEAALEATTKQIAALPSYPEPHKYAKLISFLQEMFTDASYIEVRHCVTIASGDIEGALSILLHRRDHGQCLIPGTLPARNNRTVALNNEEIKSRIIERYSYIDRESENKEHKPLTPKYAPKKMVRYRDNKIVSLKGERFTEVSKGDDEGVKKVNKKHHP